MPNVGLELITLRVRVVCSSEPARCPPKHAVVSYSSLEDRRYKLPARRSEYLPAHALKVSSAKRKVN